jgi:hypothetical protein
MKSVAVSLCGVVLTGCPDREVGEVDPHQEKVESKSIDLVINNDVDILFVIDNSRSMLQEQASLQANFDRFIDVLDNITGGLPDVHIGVVTSNLGTLATNIDPLCGAAYGDDGVLHVAVDSDLAGLRYISDVAGATPGTRVTNYNQATTTLTDEFRKLAAVGAGGCGFEMHLAAMQRGLENPANGAFLRPDAHLAIVILADEDDCSASNAALFGNDPSLGALDDFRCFEQGIECDQDPRVEGTHTNCHPVANPYLHAPSEYIDFLTALKPPGGRGDVVVAAIVGDREPVIVVPNEDFPERPDLDASCDYPNPDPTQPAQEAFPSIRLGAFVDGFGLSGTQATICTDDLSGPIETVGALIANSVGLNCLESALLDLDPSTPAIDYSCQVSLVNGVPDTADSFDLPIPECDATASVQPCWRFVEDLVHCSSYPTQLAFDIVRTTELPETTQIHAQCVVE